MLFVSLHRWPFYPGTGGPGEQNATTVNVQLSAGAGDAEYVAALEQTVEPAIRSFDPDLLIVSAGFDAAAGDPLGGMLVTADGFRELAAPGRAAVRPHRLCPRGRLQHRDAAGARAGDRGWARDPMIAACAPPG